MQMGRDARPLVRQEALVRHNFLSDITVLEIKNITSAAATGIVETAVHNTAGYESIVCLAPQFGATGSSNGLQALMGTASASASLSEVLNSYVTALSTGVGLEIARPAPFVQFQAVREASCKLGNLIVLGYKPRAMPATNSTGRFTSRVLLSPSAGQSTST